MPDSAPFPLWTLAPFAALLLCIAVLPLSAPTWWEHNRNKGLVVLALAGPLALWLLKVDSAALVHSVHEYLSFIALLGALFVVGGGIHFSGDLRAKPLNNTALLGLGAVLANLLGTTGASMVLIRLVLRSNAARRHTAHIPFFFILIVSNCGGLLTPMGDPPLFLGYLRGVPFTWTLRLWPFWLLAVAWLLIVFFWVDHRAYARETPAELARDDREVAPMRLVGWLNVPLLLGVLAAIFVHSPWRELTMVAIAAASFLAGPQQARTSNGFAFGPIVEVVVLFAGIFVTMVPALGWLTAHGTVLGLTQPWQYFLACGSLSSVLDNAPTYLAFFSAAQSLGLPQEVAGMPHVFLIAISVGSVLMGANTYIGNGPNFMVKAIADKAGYKTPSFGRYTLMAIGVLTPIYITVAAFLAV